jgi:hypothetical protein
MTKFDSERDAVGVPRDCQHMGFSATEMGRLASEGAYQLTERKMEISMDKWVGLIRHAMGTLGMYLVMTGTVDEATWTTVVGAVMTMVPFAWSWVSKG